MVAGLSVEVALLGNHSAQSPASVCVASPGHDTGTLMVKLSLCTVQQVQWSLHWVLRLGWAGGLWGLRFCYLWNFSLEEVPHSAQSPASVCVASPGHATGQFMVKFSLCTLQQVQWSLHWVLRQGWTGGL